MHGSGFGRAVECGLVAAIARLAGLCPAGAALRWIKAVCSKLKVGRGLRTPRHTGDSSSRPPTGAASLISSRVGFEMP